jgi:hypothetical protein
VVNRNIAKGRAAYAIEENLFRLLSCTDTMQENEKWKVVKRSFQGCYGKFGKWSVYGWKEEEEERLRAKGGGTAIYATRVSVVMSKLASPFTLEGRHDLMTYCAGTTLWWWWWWWWWTEREVTMLNTTWEGATLFSTRRVYPCKCMLNNNAVTNLSTV